MSYPQRPLFRDWSAGVGVGLAYVVGGDGSGKSTLLRLIAGDQAADRGALRIDRHSLAQAPQAYRASVFRTDPQADLPPQLSPLEWIDSQRARYPKLDAHRVAVLIDRLGLQEHRSKPLHMLSTGSRRKVWLVAACASEARLTLIDQPMAALDAQSIRVVVELLREASQSLERCWVVADHAVPPGLEPSQVIALD